MSKAMPKDLRQGGLDNQRQAGLSGAPEKRPNRKVEARGRYETARRLRLGKEPSDRHPALSAPAKYPAQSGHVGAIEKTSAGQPTLTQRLRTDALFIAYAEDRDLLLPNQRSLPQIE